MLSFLLLFLTTKTVSGQFPNASDPIQNFCRRVFHQSIIKNESLYIDGGLEVFVDSNHHGAITGTPYLGYNTFLLEIDMSKSWDWIMKDNLSATIINKTANHRTGTFPPPTACRGALYQGGSNDENIYLYGGTVSYQNTSAPTFHGPDSDQYSLWSYDTGQKSWDQYDITMEVAQKPASIAHTEAPDQDLAFSLGGEVDSGTSNTYAALGSGFRGYLPGLVIINTNNQTARNLSTATLSESPRARGGLTYIPGIGTNGVLLALGGTWKFAADSDAWTESFIDMSYVDIFDVASIYDTNSTTGTWYRQATSGTIPGSRTDFCLASVSAPDNSSHNIYLYGGRNGNNVYDDVYILTLPSFTWIKIYEGQSPRFGHTCHVAGNRQLISVGGSSSTNYTEGCDWESSSVAIYDMTALSWGSVFDVNADVYTVPAQIYQVIGGGADGHATMSQPVGGFNTSGIAVLFMGKEPILSNSSTTGAGPSNSNGNHVSLGSGAIAGVVVGILTALLIVLALVFIIRRRHGITTENTAKTPGEEQNDIISRSKLQELPAPYNSATSELLGSPRHELPSTLPAEASGDQKNEVDYYAELDAGEPYQQKQKKCITITS